MERSSGVKVSLLWQHFNMSSEGTEKSVSFSNCQGSALSIPASKKSVSFSGSSEDSLKTASSYRNYEEEARELVRQVIEQSLHILQEDMARSVVEWPTGENFTIEKAEEAINKVVKSWPIGNTWEYCVDYLHREDNLYCFAVKYSEPTRRKPIPAATATVYFYLLLYSKECPALVLYVLEGQRLAHRPTDKFHEVWLRNVIQNKLAVTEGLDLMAL